MPNWWEKEPNRPGLPSPPSQPLASVTPAWPNADEIIQRSGVANNQPQESNFKEWLTSPLPAAAASETPEEDRGFIGTTIDTGSALVSGAAKGLAALGPAFYSVADLATGGYLDTGRRHAQAGLQNLLASATGDDALRARPEDITPFAAGTQQAQAAASGWLETAGAQRARQEMEGRPLDWGYVGDVVTDPVKFFRMAGESLPYMLGISAPAAAATRAALARGLTKQAASKIGQRVAVGMNAPISGGTSALGVQEQIHAMPEEQLAQQFPDYTALRQQGVSDTEARTQIAQSAGGKTALVAGGLGTLASVLTKGGAEGALIRALGGHEAARSIPRALAQGALSEGVEEYLQSGGEKIGENVGMGQPLMQGTPESAALGGVLGMATGGAFGIVGATAQRLQENARNTAREAKREELAAFADQVESDLAQERAGAALDSAGKLGDNLQNATDEQLAAVLNGFASAQARGTLPEQTQQTIALEQQKIFAEQERRARHAESEQERIARRAEIAQWQRQGLQREIQRLNEASVRRAETERLERAAQEGRQRLATTPAPAANRRSPLTLADLSPGQNQLESPVLEGELLPPETGLQRRQAWQQGQTRQLRAAEQIKGGTAPIVRTPAAINAAKANDNYHVIDLPDGTAQVIGAVDPKNGQWVGTPPEDQPNEGPQHTLGIPETQEIPLSRLTLSNDVPQFKSGANEKTGVVEPLGGKYDRTGTAPIVVWERADGRQEVVSGRHRLDLARRSGEKTIPAQVLKEADGFTVDQAAMLDAELNIRDGQGKVKDYVQYFQGNGISQQEAESRGLLARPTGARAFTIANGGTESLIAAHRADAISDDAAVRISAARPGNERLQAVGIKAIQDGKSTTHAVNLMQAVGQMARGSTADATVDLFGFDDSAMKEAEQMASIAGREQRRISERLSAIQGAAKRPELAGREGVDVRNPAALQARIAEIRQERDAWENWSTNPALVAQIHEQMRPAEAQGNEGVTPSQAVSQPDTAIATPPPATNQAAPVAANQVPPVEIDQAAPVATNQAAPVATNQAAPVEIDQGQAQNNEGVAAQSSPSNAPVEKTRPKPNPAEKKSAKQGPAELTAAERELLKSMGAFPELINNQARMFLPSNRVDVMDRVLKASPIVEVAQLQQRRSGKTDSAVKPLTPTEARSQLVDAIGEKAVSSLEKSGKLEIHDTDPTKTGAAGFVDSHGVIHLVAQNLEGSALSVALHEALHVAKDERFLEGNERAHIQLAHAALRLVGLRNFIGSPSFTGLVQHAYRLAAEGDATAQKALAKAKQEWEADHRVNVPEEFVAYLAQYADPKLPIVRRIFSAIRAALYRMGFRVNLTTDDVRAIALSALKAQAKTASTTVGRVSPSYSQSDSPAQLTTQQRFEWAVAGLKLLAGNEKLFQYAVSTKKDLAELAKEISPKRELGVVRESTVKNGGTWAVTMPDGNKARIVVSPSGREVYINAADLKEGASYGSLLYQVAGQWARNTGKVFIGDPLGITEAGKARRLEHLISLAIKFNDTDFIMPHPDQNIPWKVGEHDYNLTQMLMRSSELIQNAVPDLKRLRYDFGKGKFVNRRGSETSDQTFERLSKSARARESQAGRSTLKRSVLVNTLVQEAGGRGWRSILGKLVQQGTAAQVLGEGARGTFYSQPTTAEDAAEQERLWAEFQAVQQQFQTAQASATAFERWFGRGVEGVTAHNGQPLTLYHATSATFSQFDATRAGANSKHPTSGLGFFMTADAGAAYRYGGILMELHAKIDKPYYLTDADLAGIETTNDAARFRQKLQAQGFDGAVVSAPGAAPYVIAFQSNQIKLTSNQNPTDSEDFRYSRPGQPQNLTPPPETRAQYVLRRMQDKTNRFEVVQNWLKSNGVNLTEQADVYKKEGLLPKITAARIEDAREKILKPLVERAAKRKWAIGGGQLIDAIAENRALPTQFTPSITEYLHAAHAAERNREIKKINPKFPDGGSGLTDQQAAEILRRYQALPGFQTFQNLARDFRRITQATQTIRKDAGLISAEIVAAQNSAYQNYVPLKGGPTDSAQTRTGAGAGISVGGKQKRALGHTLRDENIVENIWRDHEQAIFLSEKQKVAGALKEMLIQANNDEIGTVGQPEKRAVLHQGFAHQVWVDGHPLGVYGSYSAAKAAIAQDSQITGRAVSKYGVRHQATDPSVIYSSSPMLADNEVAYYENGQLIRLQLNDDLLARAAKNLGVDAVIGLMQAGQKFNRFLSSMYTGYNPEFILTNVIRDFTSGFINLTGHYGVRVSGKAIARYPKAVKALIHHLRTGSDPLIDRYRAAGGSTGAAYLSDLERIGTDVKRVFQDAQGARATWQSGEKAGAVRVAVYDKIRLLGRWIENMNRVGENALRVATFDTLLSEGHSVEDAARAAGNVTVNFNRKGELTNQLGALYLFFNPSIQGTKAMWDALAKGQHRGQAIALSGGLVALAFTLAQMMRGGSDDDEKRWRRLSGYTKDRNMVLFVPGLDQAITIPVPYGYGAFWSLGNIMSDLAHGEDMDQAGIRLASTLFEQFSPVGNPFAGDEADIKNIVSMVPTALKPVVSVAMNRNEMGRPIMPEVNSWNPTKPDSQRMWRGSQGSVYEQIATGINQLTFGTKYQAGLVDVSPETIKHLVRTLTGGAGLFAADSLSLGTSLFGVGGDVSLLSAREIPIARRLIRSESIQDARTLFHEQAEKIRAAESMFSAARRDRDLVAARSIMQENRTLLALGRMMDSTQSFIKTRRKLQDAIERSDMPMAAKRRQLESLEKQEEVIYSRFYDVFMRARERQRKAG